jgi:hypothetical protein
MYRSQWRDVGDFAMRRKGEGTGIWPTYIVLV